jgi:2-amino-4-hydroxy-6-hydroxymethyldihydropteridine diphosphokinase/dihydropteroate synthase
MFTLGRHELIVGLGSTESALEMLRRARDELRAHPRFRLIRSSPVYESDALLPPNAPSNWNRSYLNAACLIELVESEWDFSTDRERLATEIVALLKSIEIKLGRKPDERWAPRVIDLDLLAWGMEEVKTENASVPHLGLFERPFALLPALDCAGSEAANAWKYSSPEQVPLRTRPSAQVWPTLVGILNVTPDSFSDGGHHRGIEGASAAAEALISDGASVIDIGAESTRPDATPVTWRQEIERLEPALGALSQLKQKLGFKISLDSRHPETVEWCLERFQIDWINDVEGFANLRMIEIAARSKCDLVAMHSLGVPPSPTRTLDPSRDPLEQLIDWGKETFSRLSRSGISHDRIILDPGIGFGKTAAQNLAIVTRAAQLNALKTRFLIGHSRKRFLDPRNKIPAAERDLETALLTAQIANSGVDYIRVHSPATQARALTIGSRF